MIKKPGFNPLTGALDLFSEIPQLTSDPSSPAAHDAWVLKTGGGGAGGGVFKGFLGLGFPYATVGSGGSPTYQLSYRTEEGTTKRVTLT